jgi:hypothetical protein
MDQIAAQCRERLKLAFSHVFHQSVRTSITRSIRIYSMPFWVSRLLNENINDQVNLGHSFAMEWTFHGATKSGWGALLRSGRVARGIRRSEIRQLQHVDVCRRRSDDVMRSEIGQFGLKNIFCDL